MPRTAAGVRADTTARLDELARQRPEWQTWIRLVSVAWGALDDSRWHPTLIETELGHAFENSPANAPLLHGRTLLVDAARAHRLVRDLASLALPGARYRPRPAQALNLISAAIRQDSEAIRGLAEQDDVATDPLATVAQLAALPVLQSCGRILADQLPSHWQAGHCPVCAAWPLIAERRGLDRSRRLRCGRCAADWEVPWLWCIYCGERDHQRLGSLEPDGSGEMLKVETCLSCRGYLKSAATLQGLPPLELLLHDLESVEFDLVAMKREYRRPVNRAFPLELRLVDHASRRHL
jgi:FdhE protein